MDICFEGVGQVVATFRTEDEKLAAGMAVTLKDSGTVGLGSGDSPLCGVAVGAARGGAVAVQIGGVVNVRHSGAKPAVGWTALTCDSEGKVTKSEGDGAKCLVLAADGESVVVRL